MAGESGGGGISVIGVIPQYPKHSQQNIYGKIRMPPLGIVSVLSQLDGLKEVYCIDENNYCGPKDFQGNVDHEFLQSKIPVSVAMFYGGMSNSILRLFSLAKQYKKFGAVTIAGGSHVDALPEEALRNGVDIVVHGEGEETAVELMERIKEGKDYSDVKGISVLVEDKVVFTGKREPITDLDSVKDPDLTLIKFLERRWSAIPVNKGRGCNYGCEFCVVNKQYGKYKACSVEKVMRQIVKYSDLGYNKFFFTDDNFAQNVPETIELCSRINEYRRRFRKNIELTVQIRNEVGENDKLIEAMVKAGVRMAAIGYESPVDSELKAMNKGVTVEKLISRSRKLSKYFYLHGMFIFGYPTGEKFDIRQRAKVYEKFFRKAKLDTVQILNAVPLPGSALRDRLKDKLFPKEMVDWDKYDGLFLCYDPFPLDAYELQEIPRLLMKRWYVGSYFNYGRWMNWTYHSLTFPLQFSYFYLLSLFRNLVSKKREMLYDGNIFYVSLMNSWPNIQRRWRNVAVKSFGRGIVKRWYEAYRESGYESKLRSYFGSKV